MTEERSLVSSRRNERLAKKLKNKEYRHAFLASHIRNYLARQMRALRGQLPQEEFGKKLGIRQNVVSRLENPDYGRWTLSTLLEVANALDIGLVVRFVDYPTFVRVSAVQSDEASAPTPFDPEALDASLASHRGEAFTKSAPLHVARYGDTNIWNTSLGARSKIESYEPQLRECL